METRGSVTPSPPAPAFDLAEGKAAAEKAAPQAQVAAEQLAARLQTLGYVSKSAGGDSEEAAGPPSVEAPPYRVGLLSGTLMNVETAGYTCAVPVSQEDATTLAAIVRSVRFPRQGAVPTAAPQAPPSSPAGGVGAPHAAAAVAPRICAQLSPEDCRFVLSLVRDRYRGVLEQRCGPPPR